jgi:hypothetical protein
MRGLLTTVLLAALLCAAVVFTSGAIAAVSCGGHVTVTGDTSCRKAKAIVAEYKKTRKRHIQGFNCSSKSSGGRITVVNCKLQDKRIHWKA